MNDVVVGAGELDGKGVYAAHDFAPGEVVVAYRLRPLTRTEYLALPSSEQQFVHSYGGRRYLYPAPARYVNHGDVPNTRPDVERGCDIALRAINRGEAITIDSMIETHWELGSFLAEYVQAINRRDITVVAGLVDDDARLRLTNEQFCNKPEFLERIRTNGIPAFGKSLAITNPRWAITQHRWEALCSYPFQSSETASGRLVEVRGHGRDLLRVIDGTWQLTYSVISTITVQRGSP